MGGPEDSSYIGAETDNPKVENNPDEVLLGMEALIQAQYENLMITLRSQGMKIESRDIIAHAKSENCVNVLQLAEHIFALIMNTLEAISHNMDYLHASPASEKIALKFLSFDMLAYEKMSSLLPHHGKFVSDDPRLIQIAQRFLEKLANQLG